MKRFLLWLLPARRVTIPASEWADWLEDQRQGMQRDKAAIEAGLPLEPVKPWRAP